MVGEDGKPVPNIKYKVICPDGSEKTGSLDASGEARIVTTEGTCKVTFPDLDGEAWEKI